MSGSFIDSEHDDDARLKRRLTSQNEREIIMQLDFFVLIEYIKSAIDIILQLKFDEIE